jgi:transaldolase
VKIFLDTADIEEIRIAARWGILDGVTTNPSLYAKVGGAYEDILKKICDLTPGPVSAEVVADDVDGMLHEGRAFAKLAPNIVVKVPMSEEGLEAISRFAEEGIKTNCTLIFTANQGLLADLDTEVLAASIRHPRHVTEAALAGSHVATLPFKVLQQMVRHPLTEKGIKTFREDWDKARAVVAETTGEPEKAGARQN